MKKKIFIAGLCGSVLLAGCAGTSGGDTETTAKTDKGMVSVNATIIVINEVKKINLKKIKSQKKKPDNLSGSIELSINKIDSAISKLLDTYAFTGMPEDVLQEKITTLAKQREDLLFQLDNLKPCLSQKEIEDCFSSFNEAFKSNDISALRTVLHQLIERIEVDDDDVSISWRF